MIIGYARVSTTDQNLDAQTDALTAAGAERLFSGRISGAKAEYLARSLYMVVLIGRGFLMFSGPCDCFSVSM